MFVEPSCFDSDKAYPMPICWGGCDRLTLAPPSLAAAYIMSYLYSLNRRLSVQVSVVESFLHLELCRSLACWLRCGGDKNRHLLTIVGVISQCRVF